MIRLACVLFAVTALWAPQSPHPLDDVLGNRKVSAGRAREIILDSEEFRVVVKKAVQMARWYGQDSDGPSYAQCVRRSIANQLSNDGADPAPIGPLGHHPIEKAIEPQARASTIINSLARSAAFVKLIEEAVKQSEPLRPDEAGFTFGQGVRVFIGSELLEVDLEAESKAESTPDAPSAPVAK